MFLSVFKHRGRNPASVASGGRVSTNVSVSMMMPDPILLERSELRGNVVVRMPHTVNRVGLGEQPSPLFLFKLTEVRLLQFYSRDETLRCVERHRGPMMSHNGSIPPIRVTPGYSSQVLRTVE